MNVLLGLLLLGDVFDDDCVAGKYSLFSHQRRDGDDGREDLFAASNQLGLTFVYPGLSGMLQQDENEIVICGAFDKTPDDAYSRVIVPTLPNPFYIRISAQEEDDRVVSGYGATGDYALNIMSGTTEGYLGVLPNTISTDTDERAYEENPGYLNNYMYWPTINVGTLLDPDPYVRIINEDGDVTPEGSDIDMFKSW